MNVSHRAAGLVALLSLSGCGGGSGDVASTPAPPPANTTLKDLKYSQSFTNDTASLKGIWDTATGTAIDGSVKSGNLTISYDAGTSAYTLSADGRSETFGTADINRQDDYEVLYRKSASSGREYLTLIKPPHTEYAAMGYWQHSTTSGSRQDTVFMTFAYGLPTAAAAVPRTGSAAYGIGVFGLVTKPGEEPMAFEGEGQFSVDFSEGLFTTRTYVEEHGLVTGKSASGSIALRAGGNLSSADGAFVGNAAYDSSYGRASGTIAGRFYGPAGQELGASFQTAHKDGLVAVGSLVGARNPGLTPDNQSLTNLRHEQLFYAIGGGGSGGNLRWLNAETFDFSPPSSDMSGGRFTINDKVASDDPNFTAWAKTFDNAYYGNQQVALRMYKPGSGNSELTLTYASFGHWAGTGGGSTRHHYFAYGFITGENYLTARTGKARYEGIAYGTGINSDASARYDVKGSSSFDVDFTKQTFGGALTLAGTDQASKAKVDFGRFDIQGDIVSSRSYLEGGISRGGAGLGTLWGQFFGPDAQELAGTFWVNAPAGGGAAKEVSIQGAVATARK